MDQLASSPHTHSEASGTQEKEEIEEEVGRSVKDEKEYTDNEEEAVKRYDGVKEGGESSLISRCLKDLSAWKPCWEGGGMICYTTQSV